MSRYYTAPRIERESVKDELFQELQREPSDEEVQLESSGRIREREKDGDYFRIGLRRGFFNKRIKERMKELGLTNPTLAEMVRTSWTTISGIINFRRNPNEDLRLQLAIALQCPPEYIFPENYDKLYAMISPLEREGEVEVKMLSLNAPEARLLTAPNSDRTTEIDGRLIWNAALKEADLTPREIEILGLRFGFTDGDAYTLKDLSHKYGVGHERIRQIEAKALWKIRQRVVAQKHMNYCGRQI